MIQGIKNQGNSCYAAALIQCLRISLDVDIKLNTDQLSGNMEDPHEFYTEKIVHLIPPSVRKRLMIEYESGLELPYTMLDQHMGKPKKSSDVICVYLGFPTRDSLDNHISIIVCNRIYKLVAAVCKAGNHYYSCVKFQQSWLTIDDEHVHTGVPSVVELYMLFYVI